MNFCVIEHDGASFGDEFDAKKKKFKHIKMLFTEYHYILIIN